MLTLPNSCYVTVMASPKRAQFQLAAAHTDQYALEAHCFCSSSSFAFPCWRRSIAKLFRINHYSFSLPFFPGICQSPVIRVHNCDIWLPLWGFPFVGAGGGRYTRPIFPSVKDLDFRSVPGTWNVTS